MNHTWHCLRQQRFEQGRHAIVPVQPAHIESIRRWRNAQLDVLRQLAPISPAQQEAYYAQHIWPSMGLERPANILMALLLDDGLIGYGGLVHISWDDRRAELSFLVDDARAADPGQYARDFTAFIGLARCMAFEDLGLHRLFTETYAIRVHHIGVLEGADFQREGVLRDHVRVGGAFVDSIMHGLIREQT
jgi:RimJ/RimL family protein N-acetyltransferase